MQPDPEELLTIELENEYIFIKMGDLTQALYLKGYMLIDSTLFCKN